MTAIGVVGLGAMGSRIAMRLLEAGHGVAVWNRTPEKMAPLLEAGATRASSPADAARRSDVLLSIVADAKALTAVSEGRGGFAAPRGPRTVIEMSTVGPAAVRALRARLADDVALLDAPVLGSVSEAEAGTLTIFLGGSDEIAARWTSLLASLGRVVHVGELGTGAAAKLVANSTLFAALTGLGEALALGDALGLKRDRVFEVLEPTPLGAQAARRREAIESGEFPHRFSLALAVKDANLIASAAAEAGLDLPLALAARQWLREAVSAGREREDYSAVLAHIVDPSS